MRRLTSKTSILSCSGENLREEMGRKWKNANKKNKDKRWLVEAECSWAKLLRECRRDHICWENKGPRRQFRYCAVRGIRPRNRNWSGAAAMVTPRSYESSLTKTFGREKILTASSTSPNFRSSASRLLRTRNVSFRMGMVDSCRCNSASAKKINK